MKMKKETSNASLHNLFFCFFFEVQQRKEMTTIELASQEIDRYEDGMEMEMEMEMEMDWNRTKQNGKRRKW